MPAVSIVMGSRSDLPKIQPALDFLTELKVTHEYMVYSAHRTPDETTAWAKKARTNGTKVIIAAAGMSCALPGALAAISTLPVIGLPIKGSSEVDNQAAVLSCVCMPSGVPVLTVGLNAAKNAAIAAVRILSIADPTWVSELKNYQERMREKVLADNASFDVKK